jgi:hypothetical protein
MSLAVGSRVVSALMLKIRKKGEKERRKRTGRMEHPLVADPRQIPRHQTNRNQYQRHPEHERRPQAGNDVGVLEGEAEHRRDPGVEGEETHRESEGTGDGDESVFGPDAARSKVVGMSGQERWERGGRTSRSTPPSQERSRVRRGTASCPRPIDRRSSLERG